MQASQRGGRFGLDMFVAVEAQGRGIGPRVAGFVATGERGEDDRKTTQVMSFVRT